MNFVLRSTQLQNQCGCSKEYQLRIGPSHAMMKDLANATSSPPAELTADFISHKELSGVSEVVVLQEREWLELWRPRCSLQPF
jgi:hypothetical protein